MEVFGNGRCVIIKNVYGEPYIRVQERGRKDIYYISLPYEDGFKVWQAVSKVIQDNGKDKNFSNFLVAALKAEFPVIEFNNSKTKETPKTKKVKDVIPQIDMTATYAKVNYIKDTVNVDFINENEKVTVQFKYRKSWSHKKYIDKAISESGIKSSWNFRYGWEFIGA